MAFALTATTSDTLIYSRFRRNFPTERWRSWRTRCTLLRLSPHHQHHLRSLNHPRTTLKPLRRLARQQNQLLDRRLQRASSGLKATTKGSAVLDPTANATSAITGTHTRTFRQEAFAAATIRMLRPRRSANTATTARFRTARSGILEIRHQKAAFCPRATRRRRMVRRRRAAIRDPILSLISLVKGANTRHNNAIITSSSALSMVTTTLHKVPSRARQIPVSRMAPTNVLAVLVLSASAPTVATGTRETPCLQAAFVWPMRPSDPRSRANTT